MSSFMGRVAAAPISFGVRGARDWGKYQMPGERYLQEVRRLGFAATELGPKGYLGGTPAEVRQVLEANGGLRLVGGFVPLVLHQERGAALEQLREQGELIKAAGGTHMVIAADTGEGQYDTRPERRPNLVKHQWGFLRGTLLHARKVCKELGLLLTLHPHWGTLVQSPADVLQVFLSDDAMLCLDAGHLALAGGAAYPVELARQRPGRIGHVHLKDVNADLAEQVRQGELDYSVAVRQGLYVPLGDGCAGIAGIVETLEAAGYGGWYVLEQDMVLDEEPLSNGKPQLAVARSLNFLRALPSALTAN
jgi:inosose dehydratase